MDKLTDYGIHIAYRHYFCKRRRFQQIRLYPEVNRLPFRSYFFSKVNGGFNKWMEKIALASTNVVTPNGN